jgi:hypothetical protein
VLGAMHHDGFVVVDRIDQHRAVIDRFARDFAFLSDLTACPIGFGDDGCEVLEYPSVEDAFQARYKRLLAWTIRGDSSDPA